VAYKLDKAVAYEAMTIMLGPEGCAHPYLDFMLLYLQTEDSYAE
jgi:hypothetical protein